MYLKGVSTRKVREITEALCDAGFSAALVSDPEAGGGAFGLAQSPPDPALPLLDRGRALRARASQPPSPELERVDRQGHWGRWPPRDPGRGDRQPGPKSSCGSAGCAGYGVSDPKLADWLEETGEEALAVFHLPEAHRVRLRSTNSLEAFSGERDRRRRVVRIFPDEGACLRWIAALAMEQSEAWWGRATWT